MDGKMVLGQRPGGCRGDCSGCLSLAFGGVGDLATRYRYELKGNRGIHRYGWSGVLGWVR